MKRAAPLRPQKNRPTRPRLSYNTLERRARIILLVKGIKRPSKKQVQTTIQRLI